MSARPLRTPRASHRRGNEETASLPGAAVGSSRAAPRRADWKGGRRVTLQVSMFTCLPVHSYYGLTAANLYFCKFFKFSKYVQ